jgi:hypothetical protein
VALPFGALALGAAALTGDHPAGAEVLGFAPEEADDWAVRGAERDGSEQRTGKGEKDGTSERRANAVADVLLRCHAARCSRGG